MSGWSAGPDGYTWNTGSGVKRKTVVGPCECVLGNGATHMMRFNDLDYFFGAPIKKGTRWVAGWFTEETGFTVSHASDETTWNSCWANIHCTVNEEPAPAPQPDPTSTGWSSTPLTKSIDWRLAVAAALILVLIAYYLIKR